MCLCCTSHRNAAASCSRWSTGCWERLSAVRRDWGTIFFFPTQPAGPAPSVERGDGPRRFSLCCRFGCCPPSAVFFFFRLRPAPPLAAGSTAGSHLAVAAAMERAEPTAMEPTVGPRTHRHMAPSRSASVGGDNGDGIISGWLWKPRLRISHCGAAVASGDLRSITTQGLPAVSSQRRSSVLSWPHPQPPH